MELTYSKPITCECIKPSEIERELISGIIKKPDEQKEMLKVYLRSLQRYKSR